jgi:hypothetical protein
MGWAIHRIWSSDWWQNPERELERCEEVIAEALARADSPSPVASDPPIDMAIPLVSTASVVNEPEIVPLREFESNRKRVYPLAAPANNLGTSDDFYEPMQRPAITTQIRAILSEEGPVHRLRAYRRVATAYGLQKVTQRVIRHLDDYLFSNWCTVRGEFLWPANEEPATYEIYRVPHPQDASPRALEEIPPEELAVAAFDVLEQNIALPRPDLVREIANCFCFTRMTSKSQSVIEPGIDLLLSRGSAFELDGSVRLSS